MTEKCSEERLVLTPTGQFLLCPDVNSMDIRNHDESHEFTLKKNVFSKHQ